MNVMVGKASRRYGGESKQMHGRLGREDEHELHQPGGPVINRSVASSNRFISSYNPKNFSQMGV
jgi:hypothetical protein